MSKEMNIHASVVAFEGGGIMLQGRSGAGKSDLALRLIEAGGQLVCDDRCDLQLLDGQLIARSPDILKGLLEVRGLGIVNLPYRDEVAVNLSVELVDHVIERMPEKCNQVFLGCNIRHVDLCGFEASAVAKLRLMIRAVMTNEEN